MLYLVIKARMNKAKQLIFDCLNVMNLILGFQKEEFSKAMNILRLMTNVYQYATIVRLHCVCDVLQWLEQKIVGYLEEWKKSSEKKGQE